MKDQQSNVLVYTTKRPFWHFLLALPLYFITIKMSLKMVDLFCENKLMSGLKFTTAVFFMFVCAAGLTFTKKVYTNAASKTVSFAFTLFQIPLCRRIILKDVIYVSVYKNYSDRDFEVQIWISETKKESVSVYLSSKPAFYLASKIACGLQVDLLDATEKGNFKWIEKENVN